MADEAAQRTSDAEQHRRTYKAIMKASGEVGVPLSLALTMFFTNLVLANGVPTAFLAGVLTYVGVLFVVKMFFSH